MFEVIQMSVQHVRQPLLGSRRHRFPRVDRTSASSAWRITMSFNRSKRRNEMSSFRTWLALMISPFIKVSKKSLATSINIRTSLSLYDGSQYVVFVGSSGTTTFHTVLATFVMNLIRKTAAVLRREGKYFVFVDLALGLQREKWWWNSKPETFQHISTSSALRNTIHEYYPPVNKHIPPGGKKENHPQKCLGTGGGYVSFQEGNIHLSTIFR